jgi:uncharacterized protein (DUF1778 family)
VPIRKKIPKMPIKKGTDTITHRRNKIKDRKTLLAYMTPEEYARISKAADLVSRSLSGFVSLAALHEADEILAKHFKGK